MDVLENKKNTCNRRKRIWVMTMKKVQYGIEKD